MAFRVMMMPLGVEEEVEDIVEVMKGPEEEAEVVEVVVGVDLTTEEGVDSLKETLDGSGIIMSGMKANQQKPDPEGIVWKTEIEKIEETMREKKIKIEDTKGRKRHLEEIRRDQIVEGDPPVEGDLVVEGGLGAVRDLTAEEDLVAGEDLKIIEDKIITEDKRETMKGIVTRNQKKHMKEAVKEEARGGQ